jgi:hypothetical protein
MAILHGETAKWPKQKADRNFTLIVLAALTITMIAGIFIGIGVTASRPLIALSSLALSLPLMVVLARLANKPLRELGKQRIFHWRGAQTEALVAWIIKDALDNSWHLFNGIKLQQSWDIDHVLIGPGGIFAISTKSQRGCFSLNGTTLLLNNQPTDLAKQALGQALELRKRLEALMGTDAPFVQSILAVPFAYTDFDETSQTTWVLHQENLTDILEAQATRNRLPKIQLSRTLETIKTLSQNAAKLYRP